MELTQTVKNYFILEYYTEGPVMDAAGNLYYTSLSGGCIFKRDKNRKEEIWAKSNCPNGQVILSTNGNHLVCDSGSSEVRLFDPSGNFLKNILEGFCAEESFTVPNDIIEDSRGNIYITHSVRYDGKVGRIGQDGTQTIIACHLDYPNGLTLSNDEKILYVAESYKNRIIAIRLNHEGLMEGEPQAFAVLPENPSGMLTGNLPDGLKTDEEGNIWVAHYGMGMVHRINVNGLLTRSLHLPFQLPSNLYIERNKIIVTGGMGEPGPGCIIEIEL